MRKLNIAIKNKTKLTEKLEKIYDITYDQKQSLISKMTFKARIYPDIYFFQGILTKETIELIENCPLVIVSSMALKEFIITKVPNLNWAKIHVVYPYINSTLEYNQKIKESFRENHNISNEVKIILFTAKDLSKNGIKYFFEIINGLQNTNFHIVIQSDKKQIEQLKLQLNRVKVNFDILFLEDYDNPDELFIASDIVILPIKQKAFSVDLLKAMYFQNAVFLPSSNYASELIDTFSTMNSLDDPSTSFKVDALLNNDEELHNVQKLNFTMCKKFTLENRFEVIKLIIEKNLD